MRCTINFQCELTSLCNLTCGYCPNRLMKRKKEFMSDTVWHNILHHYMIPYHNENRFCPPTFIPHKDGEPLLVKNIQQRIKDVADHLPSMSISIYSHGLMLPILAKKGKDFIDFLSSISNPCRYLMSYHPYNHDGSVNDYSDVISYLRNVLENKPANVEFITVITRS